MVRVIFTFDENSLLGVHVMAELAIGTVFDSTEDAIACVNRYNQTNFTNFVVMSNCKKTLLYRCRHGVQRTSKSNGVRPNQHYNFVGCEATIRMYKAANGSWKVTKLILEHANHVVYETVHRFNNENLNDEDIDLIRTLKEANTKTSQIKRMLCTRTNKRMSTQRVKNLIAKLVTETSTPHADALEECLESLDADGGTVKFTYDGEGCVDSLFISSAQMKRKFVKNNPFCIQMDTTFNIEEGKYKLVAFCYLDLTSNRTEVAAFALVAAEGEGNFNFVLSELKSLNQRNDYIFLVDKDFTEIETIRRIFPGVVVLLCTFHVFKFMRSLITTALTTQEIKKEIFEKFRALTLCPSRSLYEDLKKNFLDVIKDIQVRSNGKYVSFTAYYLKNWDSCTEMWVKFHRNDLPLFGDGTTNRIERTFWSFKQSLADRFTKTPKTSEAIIHLVDFINERLEDRRIVHDNKRLVIFDADTTIHDLNKEASQILNEKGCILFHKSLSLLRERRKKLMLSDAGVTETFQNNEVKLYSCTEVSCICTFHKENLVPCYHMLFCREQRESRMFDASTFDQRYRRDAIDQESDDERTREEITEESPDYDIPEDITGEAERVSLTDNEKYKIIMPILNNIATLVSCHSTNTFLQYVEEFKSVENKVRRGKSVTSAPEIQQSVPASTSLSIPASAPASVPELSSQESYLPRSADSTETLNRLAANPNAEPISKFQLKFKKALSTKGRPRKRSKQMANFNKTRLDRKENENIHPDSSFMLPQPVRFPVNEFEVNNHFGSFLAELGDCTNITTESSSTAYTRTFTNL